jgi:hypothetical protein
MISAMDEAEFWEIVASTRRAAGDAIAGQPSALRELLEQRSAEDVLAFDRALRRVSARADTDDMGHAAGLFLGGVGDDSFEDFRTWLICHGRETFDRALADPDTLVDLSYDDEMNDFGVAEHVAYVASEVYAARVGTEAPDDFEWSDRDDPDLYEQDTLRARFPRLWARAERRHPEYLALREVMVRVVRVTRQNSGDQGPPAG